MNKISLYGTVISNPEFSHKVLGENFYEFYLEVKRISGIVDTLKCVASELFIKDIIIGEMIRFDGEIRTFNIHLENGKTKLDVFTFVTSNPETISEDFEIYVSNSATIEGFICKKSDCRQTPNGREVTDMLIAVNRGYGKSDYIPAICWGRNAHRCDTFQVGDAVRLEGRLQSREYKKRIGEDEYETRTAYEFSAKSIEIIVGEV